MPRENELPPGAIRVRRYEELDRYVEAYANGRFGLMIVIGDPGVGKSRRIKQAIGDKARIIEGNASAFRTYIDLYQHRDEPIVLDDVGGLDADPQWVHLFKCICQTDEVKAVGWQTQTPALDREGVPRSFETRSRVAIICNRMKARNRDVDAVLDRAQLIAFDPSPVEVHRCTAEWFRDQEIFDFVGRHLHLAPRLSMRDYHLAAELKSAGMEWREKTLARWELNPKTAAVARLKADASYRSEEARAKAFKSEGHGSRASYFVHARKLAPVKGAAAPKIVLGPSSGEGTGGGEEKSASRGTRSQTR